MRERAVPDRSTHEHPEAHSRPPRTLIFQELGEMMIFVCGERPLDCGEWDEYLAALARAFTTKSSFRSLVYAHSAQPTPVQRGKLNAVLSSARERGVALKSAVITPSVLVRGAITALQWFHRDVFRAFAPRDLDKALAFIDSNADEAVKAKQVLRTLQNALGVRPPLGG